jgi:hypothetical protein
MNTLPEILRDVMLLLDGKREYVVIARGPEQVETLGGRGSAFQIRFRLGDGPWYADNAFRARASLGLLFTEDDSEQSKITKETKIRSESRSWLGGEWSKWREHCGWLGGPGFDIGDVIATDWRIIS